MTPQQILENCLVEMQKQGVKVVKHPTGTNVLQSGGGRVSVFQYPNHWKVQYSRVNSALFHDEEYAHEDIETLVLTLLRWGWNNGAKPL